MADAGHLLGPDGLRVEAITLGNANVAYTRRRHPDAQTGQPFFLATRHGKLVEYHSDIEGVAEHVDLVRSLVSRAGYRPGKP